MKSVLIELLSDFLGDTVSSTPYVSEYQKIFIVHNLINQKIYVYGS